MTFETIGVVKYFPVNNYYTVGNNETEVADGITDTSYEGEIIIHARIKCKPVLEISKYAFYNCHKITKITIYAKLRSINKYGVCYCISLLYINIPETVTFIGNAGVYTGKSNVFIDLPMTVEFNKGRRKNFYIDQDCFTFRRVYYVIYPSSFVPEYTKKWEFVGTKTVYVCAPSAFNFYTKETTTDQTLCPTPTFKQIALHGCTNQNKPQISILYMIFLIILLS